MRFTFTAEGENIEEEDWKELDDENDEEKEEKDEIDDNSHKL